MSYPARVLIPVLACLVSIGCSEDDDTGDARDGSGDGADFGNPDSIGGGGASGFGQGPVSGSVSLGPATDSEGNLIGGKGCASADVSAQRVKPTVLFVIDGSGSMSDPFGGTNRWSALRDALMDPNGGVVPTLEGVVEFGMVMYDGPILAGFLGGACPQLLIVDPALNNFGALDALYPQQPLGGSTPTHIALDFVVNNLADTSEVALDNDLGPQFVVLATDGAPNDLCGGGAGDPQAAVLAAAMVGMQKGIKMFVISLAEDPGLIAHLEQVAVIGNTGSPPFTPTTKDELTTLLTQLVGGAVGCEVVLNGKVTLGAECQGFVEVNGNRLPCNDPSGEGWILKSENTIELIGQSCLDFKNNPQSMLHADFPCNVFVPE